MNSWEKVSKKGWEKAKKEQLEREARYRKKRNENIQRKPVSRYIQPLPLVLGYSDAKNWMSRINDGVNLTKLSIPGTHDSGSLHDHDLLADTAKTQNVLYAEQLNMGVRFLDIRGRHRDNMLEIHHGMVYQEHDFKEVLRQVHNFLRKNPTETVIMAVKDEYDAEDNTRSYEATFRKYLAYYGLKWYLGTTIPSLGEVRGKIVLMRRFGASGDLGIDLSNWRDTIHLDGGQSIRIQDEYQASDWSYKWGRIEPMFKEAYYGPDDTLYMNFTSAYQPQIFGISKISIISDGVNRALLTSLKVYATGRLGMIIMDFVNAELALRIVNANFIRSYARMKHL